jgi:dihydrolipoamide dehydrogenase
MTNYDLIVIGAGPGGYVAAIKAAQLGKKVAVVEKNKIGGTCLNVGCIPSKSYLQHAHWLLSLEEGKKHGVDTTLNAIDFPKMVDRKNGVVQTLQSGIHHLFSSNKIDYIEGEASFVSPTTLEVSGKQIAADKVLLATGGKPFVPPINGIENAHYDTTDTFFSITELPEKLVVIGGGIIAVELAFAMKPLGVDVTLVEVAKDILLTEDPEARKIIKKKLTKMGISITTSAKIDQVTEKAVIVDGKTFPYDRLLVAAGRKPDLTLAGQLAIELDEAKRFIQVNDHYQTSVPTVYAIGDVIGGYQLAHVASHEGIRAVEAMFGTAKFPVDKTSVPRCLYTSPEVASFGLSEEEAKEQFDDVVVKSMAFSGNGKAIASMETDGFVKIISEKQYHQILGAVIVGSHATEMIHTILAVKEAEGTIDEIDKMIFAHPTLSEVIGETSNSLFGRAIHG